MAMIKTCKMPDLQTKSASGAIATFNTALAMPLSSCKIAITATQSGNGTPSPSNPRPISGYSAINISHSDADTSNPTVYTTQIGSTVYGGEYDARTGVFTVTHIYKQYDKDSPWEVGTGNAHIFIAAESDYPYGTKINGMSNYFKPAYTAENSVWLIYRQFHVRPDSTICPSGTTTVEGLNEFKTWLADGNKIIQYVQPLDEPITIQLPPCPIETLLGENNIWADTGDVDLTFKDLDIAKRGNFREVFKLP